MTGNTRSTTPASVDDDEAPDLSDSKWQEKIAAASVRRGRPLAKHHKVATTIRLDPDVMAHFRSSGQGWQSRINAALREWVDGKRNG